MCTEGTELLLPKLRRVRDKGGRRAMDMSAFVPLGPGMIPI